jgi:hypothetical protein
MLHERTPSGVRFVLGREFGAKPRIWRGAVSRDPAKLRAPPSDAIPMPVLDSPLLQATLRDELRAAWIHLRATCGSDPLYGFGVYTTSSASYLMVTAFSERGLDQVVQRYLRNEYGKGQDVALLRRALRWSPADSPLHAVGSDLLPGANKIVADLDFEGRWQLEEDDEDDEDFDDEWVDPEVVEVFQVLSQILRELDQEGLFGTGAERERLVLSIWEGDQSNQSRYDNARALNPPAVTRRFGEEMNDAVRVSYAMHHPDLDPPVDDFE